MNAKEKCDKVPQYKCNKKCGLGCLGCKTYNIYSKGYQDAKKENQTALKDYKELDLRVKENNLLIDTLQKVIKKLEEVLKIIKEKKVAINILLMSANAYVYNQLYDVVIIPSGTTPKYEWKLTDTEFDTIKEAMK